MNAPSLLEQRRSIQRLQDALVYRDKRAEIEPCAVTDRDINILVGLWRLKFLNTSQIAALWFEGSNQWAWQRRLLKLFGGGFVERFRPNRRQGTYEWTYVLSNAGYKKLEICDALPEDAAWVNRNKIEFPYVIHDLELNWWLIAIKEAAGKDFQGLWGEAESKLIAPNQEIPKGQLGLGSGWLVDGIKIKRARSVIPDASIQLPNSGPAKYVRCLIEYDRTKRADELRKKLERYDFLLNWWWQLTEHGERQRPPQVIFVCKDEDHLQLFLDTADRELEGCRRNGNSTKDTPNYRGRDWIYFCLASDAYNGSLTAWKVPAQPAGRSSVNRYFQKTSLVR